jgi:hypothetical protein
VSAGSAKRPMAPRRARGFDRGVTGRSAGLGAARGPRSRAGIGLRRRQGPVEAADNAWTRADGATIDVALIVALPRTASPEYRTAAWPLATPRAGW